MNRFGNVVRGMHGSRTLLLGWEKLMIHIEAYFVETLKRISCLNNKDNFPKKRSHVTKEERRKRIHLSRVQLALSLLFFFLLIETLGQLGYTACSVKFPFVWD